jgi:hypothetical protein
MIFASINPGHYLIIEDDRVIAEVERKFGWSCGYWTSIGYTWKWRSTGVEEFFRNLPEIHEIYLMDNYPGYGKVLRNNADKKAIRGKVRRYGTVG